jgi:hypothetical protein
MRTRPARNLFTIALKFSVIFQHQFYRAQSRNGLTLGENVRNTH